MSRITRLLRDGASFTAGLVLGSALTNSTEPDKNDEEHPSEVDMWQGRELEFTLTFNDAMNKYAEVVGWLQYDLEEWKEHEGMSAYGVEADGLHPYWQDDLKDLRLSFAHALADAEPGDDVTITVTDRQRLLIFDLTFGGPPLSEIREIGYHYVE